jgi:hypothetical protein
VPAIALHGGTPRRAGEACLRRRRGRQAPACPARFGVGASLRLMSAVVFPEPGLLTRRLLPQPFVAGATRGCSRFMVPRRVLWSVGLSLNRVTVQGAATVRERWPDTPRSRSSDRLLTRAAPWASTVHGLDARQLFCHQRSP